jgi:hypothetical protein
MKPEVVNTSGATAIETLAALSVSDSESPGTGIVPPPSSDKGRTFSVKDPRLMQYVDG